MGMKTYTYRYKGWLGLCPVYISDMSHEGPMLNVDARHWCLDWFFALNCEVISLLNDLTCMLIPDFEPGMPVRVGDKLPKPITMEFWEDD